jgi:O-methyltransferase domain/Dimerisation domain
MDKGAENETNRVRQLIMGFRTTQLIYVAAKFGLADHLARGPLTPRDLAAAVGAEPEALFRLMRALASLGIFAELTDGRFEMTPAAEVLRRDRPGSLRSTALVYGDELLWGAYGRLSHAIETGQPAFAQVYGQPFYGYLEEHSDAATLFHDAMTGFSELEAAAIMAAYDFSAVRSLVDVGGGQGGLVAALLGRYPCLRAIVFDRAKPTEAEKVFASPQMGGRGRFIQGDFFAAVPEGGDLYLLKSVIHNWDDAAAASILRNCRKAMSGNGRLLLVERVIPSGNAPSEAKLFDINMLVTVGGRERTEAQYTALLRSVGLQLTKVTPTKSHVSLIEAVKANRC